MLDFSTWLCVPCLRQCLIRLHSRALANLTLHTRTVLVASLRASLEAAPSSSKTLMLHFNAEGAVDSTRCTAVAWVPGTQGSAFVAAHASGRLHVYPKVRRVPCVESVFQLALRSQVSQPGVVQQFRAGPDPCGAPALVLHAVCFA